MSIGPLPALAGAGGTPPAQSKTVDMPEPEGQERRAESAAGVGAPDGERLHAGDRDADGRRAWELPPAIDQPDPTDKTDRPHPRAKDPSGQSGSQLDLTA